MTLSGVSPEYIVARTVLLDALAALDLHLDAIVLVGAQAVYLHTGDADLATAPTTTDADIVLTPSKLANEPLLEDALRAAGFMPGGNPGTWRGKGDVAIDLMVPDALSGAGGRRGARLTLHGNRVARRTLGLEPAILDNEFQELTALDSTDPRRTRIRVAGIAALLVAKIIKIEERLHDARRLQPKDGLDVLRLLRVANMPMLANKLRELSSDEMAGEVTKSAIAALQQHGTTSDGSIAALAAAAVAGFEDPVVISQSVSFLVDELLQIYRESGL